MGVYEDMANDAGYAYDTDENECMAQLLEAQDAAEYAAWQEEKDYMDQLAEMTARAEQAERRAVEAEARLRQESDLLKAAQDVGRAYREQAVEAEARLAAVKAAVDGIKGLGCDCQDCLDIVRTRFAPDIDRALSSTHALAVVEVKASPAGDLDIDLSYEVEPGSDHTVVVMRKE